MLRFCKTFFAAALLLGISLSTHSFAQVDAGRITGTVTDPSGAAIANSSILAHNINTGLERTAQSNNSGEFTLPGVPTGTYKVTVSSSGFNSYTAQVEVTVGGAVSVEAKLGVQGANAQVEVTVSGIAQINTTTPEVAQVIDSSQLQNLPSLTRNPYDFAALSGNVSGDPNGSTGPNGVGIAINGLRSASTEILLDGVENVNLFGAAVGQTIPLDSAAEFRLISNGFSAEYGRASGGIINLATRSGTNSYHGALYEYNRISALAANTYNEDSVNYYNNLAGLPNLPHDRFVRNQFGYALGGPVGPKLKDKVFFFSNTEWTRVRSAGQQFAEIPTQAFIATTAPNTQAFFTQYGKLAPGAVLGPVSSDHPEFQQVSYSVATDAGAGSPQNTWETLNRVDWNISDKSTFFARYGLDSFLFPAGTISFSPYDGYNTGETDYDQAILLSFNHIFTPNLISSSKLSYNRFNDKQPLGAAPVGPTLYPNSTSILSIDGQNVGFPGYLPFTPGNSIPFGGPQNFYQYGEDLTWIKGAHSFRFGGAFDQLRDNRLFGAYETSVQGLASSSSCFFAACGSAANPRPSGLENLTTGNIYNFQGAVNPQGKYPCTYTYDPATGLTTQNVDPACTLTLPVGQPNFVRQNTFNDGSFYGQDTWKATPRFTVTAGIRWEYYGVQHNHNPAEESNFFQGTGGGTYNNIRNGQVELTTQSGGLYGKDLKNWAPRFGFAWDVFGDGKWAVRGGYGLSYERNFGNVTYNVIQNPPNYAVVSVTSGVDIPGSYAISNDNAGPLAGTGAKALPRVSLRAVDTHIPIAYANQYSFDISHEIVPGTTVSLEYSGSRGIHQYTIVNLNRQWYGNIFLGDDPNNSGGNALNLQYSNINYRGAEGDSYYNALNVRLESQNFANQGLQIITNYTRGRAMDTLSSTFSQSGNNFALGQLDPFNIAYDRGNSDYDTRNRLSLAAIYVPKFLTFSGKSEVVQSVFGGWTIAPIFSTNSGTAYTIYDCSFSYGYACPHIINSPTLKFKGTSQVEQGTPNAFNFLTLPTASANPYFDPIVGASDMPTCNASGGNCYMQPGLARNQWYGPAFWNLDTGVYKNFKIKERYTLQLRGEFYNIFNHHNLYVNGENADYAEVSSIQAAKGAPGGISTPDDERRNVQLALRFQF
jgi:outer membrane receptor protein involved in Fe transport